MAIDESLLRGKILKETDYAMKSSNRIETMSRQTQVAEECMHLTNEIDKLHEIISKLDDKLSTILRYSDPKPEDAGEAESLVPHAEFIRGKAWLVTTATERIEDILRRLEL